MPYLFGHRHLMLVQYVHLCNAVRGVMVSEHQDIKLESNVDCDLEIDFIYWYILLHVAIGHLVFKGSREELDLKQQVDSGY